MFGGRIEETSFFYLHDYKCVMTTSVSVFPVEKKKDSSHVFLLRDKIG